MSAREELLAHTRSILWRAWSTSSEELASAAVDTLMGLGMLVPEGGAAELERLRGGMASVREQEIRNRRLDEVTAGPWLVADGVQGKPVIYTEPPGGGWPGTVLLTAVTASEADVQFVASARRSVPELLDEVSRLRARVAELEAERHATNEVLSDAAEQLRADRDRIAELETLTPATFQTCRTCGAGYEYGHPCSTCQFKALMAVEAAVRPCGCPARFDRHAWGCPTTPVEDPHDSPLHHTYRVGRDFPRCECSPAVGRHTSACPARFGSEVPRG
ncbi:hypothetical protein [Streptomyces lavendulae]|uniref:hypothetical protein n=1 Tax=Streptomyces lavendulae TaxID=1914 RepID=UPI0033F8E085